MLFIVHREVLGGKVKAQTQIKGKERSFREMGAEMHATLEQGSPTRHCGAT